MLVALLLLGAGINLGGAFEPGADDASSAALDPKEANLIEDRIIVGFVSDVPVWFQGWMENNDATVYLQDEVLNWVAIDLPGAGATDAAFAELQIHQDVRYVEYDVLDELQYIQSSVIDLPLPDFGEHIPNDPLYSSQWGYPAIKAPEAWSIQTGSHNVKVAVLDTGIMGNHPDLMANICGPHESFVPGEPPLQDWHFHGTHVAGSVAAVSDNNLGVAGTSQSCLMDVQVCTQWGSCPRSGSNLAKRWAADNGADIISMSFGGGSFSQGQADAAAYAYAKDVLLIAAAGNSGCFGQDRVIYPAKLPEVVAVAALQNPGNNVAGFSSCGPEVEVAAPGASVLSTNNNGGYRYASGTSMAAPHASGVAALIKSENPDLSAAELRCTLARTSDDILALGPDIHTGWGRVNMLSGVTLGVVLPKLASSGAPDPNAEQLAYLAANSCTPGLDVL